MHMLGRILLYGMTVYNNYVGSGCVARCPVKTIYRYFIIMCLDILMCKGSVIHIYTRHA